MNDFYLNLGWDPDFHRETGITASFSLARVMGVEKESFRVRLDSGEIPAELSGKFLYGVSDALALPAVGDWVLVSPYDEGSRCIIQELLPRKSLLKRKSAGREFSEQLIAANVDFAFITMALDHNFSLRRLERYLIVVRDGSVSPVILLTKKDLLDESALSARLEEVAKVAGEAPVLALSPLHQEDLSFLSEFAAPARTVCFLGSSGVGKSTLINRLLGEQVQKTTEVREGDSHGRHATTSRSLFIGPGGEILIDTPGMRELGLGDLDEGLAETFADLEALVENCKFKDCTHESEPGCALLAAEANGELDGARRLSYLKLLNEKTQTGGKLKVHEKRRKEKALHQGYKKIMNQKRKTTGRDDK